MIEDRFEAETGQRRFTAHYSATGLTVLEAAVSLPTRPGLPSMEPSIKGESPGSWEEDVPPTTFSMNAVSGRQWFGGWDSETDDLRLGMGTPEPDMLRTLAFQPLGVLDLPLIDFTLGAPGPVPEGP